MNPISTWTPLSRALYAFLIGIAAVLAMPRNAHAQSLYVSHIPALSEYNAITGELIDANFITEVDPFALVVDESE